MSKVHTSSECDNTNKSLVVSQQSANFFQQNFFLFGPSFSRTLISWWVGAGFSLFLQQAKIAQIRAEDRFGLNERFVMCD